MNGRAPALPVPRENEERTGHGPLDWNVAVGTALRLLKPGPEIERSEAEHAVRALRSYSSRAETHVRELTGMGRDLPVREGDVVDRPAWVHGAASGLSALTDTALTAPAVADTAAGQKSGSDFVGAIGSKGAGVQAGVVLSYLGTRVLGQYDPFLPAAPGGEPGRLVLVAPNIVAAQRSLDVPAEDFQMWVCLHESTHRLQFNAVPWLREHFTASLSKLLGAMNDDSGELLGRLSAVVRTARDGGPASPGVLGVIEMLQTPEQRTAFDRVIAISTLLEGHADHVMDAVGPQVVPSVGTIRQRFTERRKGGGLFDRVLRSLLGMDAKMKQYAEGAEFTRHIVDAVGMDGFNAVWAAPENLPSRAEITAPASWLRRVHG